MLSERAKWEKEMGSAIARLKAEMGESIRGHGAAQVGSAAAKAYCCPTDLHCPWSAAAMLKIPIGLRRSIGWPPSICYARRLRACSVHVCIVCVACVLVIGAAGSTRGGATAARAGKHAS
jgi:hypothetical protein